MKKLLLLLPAFILMGCQTPHPSSNLKDSASFPIGTAIRAHQLVKDSSIQAIVKKDFNSITLENGMKMYAVHHSENEYNWKHVDDVVHYAQQNNIRLHGHAFIWHSGTPRWINEMEPDSTALDKIMEDYILTYGKRYQGKVAGWDVVNEALLDSTGEFRKSIWYKTMGEGYIARAFELAHKADPGAVLFYNDFNIERDTVKLHSMLRMIEKLRAQNVPISGIGFQMHIRMDTDEKTIEYALKKAAETGLQIHLSEIDIIFNKHDDTPGGGIQIYDELTEEMLQAQADKYQWLAEAYIRNVPKQQRYGMTVWGFSDKHSWIPSFFDLNDWPCIYDENMNPKPAYYGFIKGLKTSK
ncbi:endo-1,4-beta-xylanase [Marinilabilia salmonicolor]|jgi:endo-1,4-beta-xylanase|uniref:Beta-xylanase n=1 Tax=Marinilabilia salmonicolor TaxID=989 RepID=A0A2T0XCI0_9BACT|nr:endo-1,4-beta-xylanase [Marinilabilia salmonicolor]PRY96617.1 endo-1,4-beta-xylanase [Marinilabilia salmonicolor]RCW33237.1 endo-1,4-beta-xylanase [Marinilabilia salmonicolor]